MLEMTSYVLKVLYSSDGPLFGSVEEEPLVLDLNKAMFFLFTSSAA